MNKQKNTAETINIRRICAAILAIYVIFVLAFYFLAGEQLKLRRSRGIVEMPAAEIGTVELTRGMVIEQLFSVDIQRLESLSVTWGAYYRANVGTVTMELVDTRDGAVLLATDYDATALAEGSVLTLAAGTPIENCYGVPLVLRITADSPVGSGATPLMTSQTQEGWQLTYNGRPVDGTLCMAVEGTDYIWTGLHYWKFIATGAVLLCMLLGAVCYKKKNGKHSYIVNAFIAVKKYRFLIRQLVSRDFKTKYKRSVLGVFWSFLNPLLSMCVQYVVFSTIFKSDIPHYAAYLLIGIVAFNFFSEACGMSLTSILGNGGLITKVYMPKYIYPLTRVMSSVINLTISLIPLILICLFTGVQFHKSAVLALFFIVCLVIFSLGLGLLLSASMVFFRDTQFLWNVFSMIWMYATPIFYPENIIPASFKWVHTFNPLYHFLQNMRICILDGISPEPSVYVYSILVAVVMLLVGAQVFRKSQDKFVLYL